MKIYYIVGASRSGSTIFSQALSSVIDANNIGEYFLSNCNEYIHELDLPCSCGMSYSNCNFWGGEKNNDFHALKLISKRAKMRYAFFKPKKAEIKYFNNMLENLKKKFGKDSLLVEVSKNPIFLKYLINSDVDFCVIHLTRNPFDSIESWKSKKQYLDKKKFWRAFHDWFFMNYVAVIFLKYKKINYSCVKYEDFCFSPRSILLAIEEIAKEEIKLEKKYDQNKFVKHSFNHALAGNPAKLDLSNLIIIKDIKFKQKLKLSSIKKILLKLVGLPFGY